LLRDEKKRGAPKTLEVVWNYLQAPRRRRYSAAVNVDMAGMAWMYREGHLRKHWRAIARALRPQAAESVMRLYGKGNITPLRPAFPLCQETTFVCVFGKVSKLFQRAKARRFTCTG
jgi:hypothetical protein